MTHVPKADIEELCLREARESECIIRLCQAPESDFPHDSTRFLTPFEQRVGLLHTRVCFVIGRMSFAFCRLGIGFECPSGSGGNIVEYSHFVVYSHMTFSLFCGPTRSAAS